MHCGYRDIRDKISDPPMWFDENAVPRYVPFSPRELSNIYAREAALVEIACQNCQTKFKVAFSRCAMDDVQSQMMGVGPVTLAETIKEKTIHYGDPPNIGCCPAGPTMNSDPLRVLEFWTREELEWVRDYALEIDIADDE